MKDYVSIGSVPYDEKSVQVGEENYQQLSNLECRVFADQIRREFKERLEKIPCKVVVKSFPHDFGSYQEVCIIYDNDSDEQGELAFDIESDISGNWDEISLSKLDLKR